MKEENRTAACLILFSLLLAISIPRDKFPHITGSNNTSSINVWHSPSSGLDYKVEIISLRPNLTMVYNFLTYEETEILREYFNRVKDRMAGSTAVVLADGYGEVLPNTVSSTIMRFASIPGDKGAARAAEVVRRIDERVSEFSGIPIPNHEPLAYIHYDPNQYFSAHLDAHLRPGRPTSTRIATMFMYLNDEFEGGETIFPLGKRLSNLPDILPESCVGHDRKNPERQPPRELEAYLDGSEDGFVAGPDQGIVIKPIRGAALLWWNVHPNGTCNVYSRHGGCPVIGTGEKLGLTKWMYSHQFGKR